MLTLFSIPKAFEGHTGIIQRNAVRSWRQILPPSATRLLLGDDAGTAHVAREVGARHVPHVERDQYGTPIVSSVFETGAQHAPTDVLCYVNADIVLFSDFMATVARLEALRGPFMAVGQRTDVDVTELMPVDALRNHTHAHGTLHKVTGIDYFIYRRGTLDYIPPFALGRWRWDNWLLWDVLRRDIPLIDVTSCVLAAHQNHDYRHHNGHGDAQLHANNALVKHTGGKLCTIADATHEMTPDYKIIEKVRTKA